jgi:hypothetical protein
MELHQHLEKYRDFYNIKLTLSKNSSYIDIILKSEFSNDSDIIGEINNIFDINITNYIGIVMSNFNNNIKITIASVNPSGTTINIKYNFNVDDFEYLILKFNL